MTGRTLRVAAQLLCYPDAELLARAPLLRAAVATLDRRPRSLLAEFLDRLDLADQPALARAYVETFDLQRRCCLYLTYYSYGDTRKRGMALLRFSHAYRSAGYVLDGTELPDHLAVVCEFAAAAPREGMRLLAEQRAGLELLRMAMHEQASPWLPVVDAVRCVLPAVSPRDLDRALALARSGPPAEEVGLEPFAPPEYMGGRR